MFDHLKTPRMDDRRRNRLKLAVRERFALTDAETVMVTQIACTVPGCPPLETVITFWTADGIRHHFKIFKPFELIADDDLPPGWMKSVLISNSDEFCC